LRVTAWPVWAAGASPDSGHPPAQFIPTVTAKWPKWDGPDLNWRPVDCIKLSTSTGRTPLG